MSKNMKRLLVQTILGLFVIIFIGIICYYSDDSVAKAPDNPFLERISDDSRLDDCNVYIYRFYDGMGGYHYFIVATKKYKDGIAVTQIK